MTTPHEQDREAYRITLNALCDRLMAAQDALADASQMYCQIKFTDQQLWKALESSMSNAYNSLNPAVALIIKTLNKLQDEKSNKMI